MSTVFQEAISAYNLPLTLLLGLIGMYWLISLVGLMDFDALDGVLGTDSDGHGHGHDTADGDHGDGDDGHGQGFFAGLMKVMGATDAPIMFVITLYSLLLWSGNMLGNIYFNAGRSGTLATGILAASLVGAFVLTRLLVRPLRPLMKLIRDTESRVPLVGLTGTVRSLTLTETDGQVEVLRDGAPILLHARVAPGRESLPRGAEVLVVSKLEIGGDRDIYTVRPLGLSGETKPSNAPVA